jgi:hypothetical protein
MNSELDDFERSPKALSILAASSLFLPGSKLQPCYQNVTAPLTQLSLSPKRGAKVMENCETLRRKPKKLKRNFFVVFQTL